MTDDVNSANKTSVNSDQTNYNPASGSMVKEAERPATVPAPEIKAQPEIPPSLEAELEKAKESSVVNPPQDQQGVIKTPKEEVSPSQEASEIEDSKKRLGQIERTKKTSTTDDSVFWLHELLKKVLKQFGLKKQ